jgi:hypothetical protein
MQIKHSVEKEDGTYVYQGSFTGKELDFLVEYACNSLLAQGAFPFVTAEKAAEPGVNPPVSSQPQ